jgi:hypothetical protein
MNCKDGMIRVVIFGSVYLFTQSAAAFAEKVTLGCGHGPEYTVLYYTFDMEVKTVKDAEGGTFPIQVTEDEIYWKWQGPTGYVVVHVYNRQTTQLTVYYSNGAGTIACQRVPRGPL